MNRNIKIYITNKYKMNPRSKSCFLSLVGVFTNCNIFKSCFFFLLLVAANGVQAQKNKKAVATVLVPGKVWTAEKANAWYSEHKWLTGANYIPATAFCRRYH
jgi:hypothetical protein